MNRVFIIPVLTMVGALTIAVPARAETCDDGGQKVLVCHAAGKGRFQTLKISKCAVQSHLTNHNDYLGACETNCALGASCDDGNACTSDSCNAITGACEHSTVQCDDGNSCTAESCDPLSGCVSTPRTGQSCDDGNVCSSTDVCTASGTCLGTPITGCCFSDSDCDDGNACTQDSCDETTRICRNAQRVCEDGNPCTVDVCNPQTGACAGTPVVCDPGFTCNPATGTCQSQGVPEVCGDGIDNDLDGATDEGCIGDRAWNDANVNGLQDPGETGVAGSTFLLRTSSGALVAVAVSNATGTYHFSGVPAGNYYIEVVLPAGFGITSPDAGGDDNVDSDFDGESLATPVFFFTGASDNSWDAGLVAAPQQ